jgi:hypothetical protein
MKRLSRKRQSSIVGVLVSLSLLSLILWLITRMNYFRLIGIGLVLVSLPFISFRTVEGTRSESIIWRLSMFSRKHPIILSALGTALIFLFMLLVSVRKALELWPLYTITFAAGSITALILVKKYHL